MVLGWFTFNRPHRSNSLTSEDGIIRATEQKLQPAASADSSRTTSEEDLRMTQQTVQLPDGIAQDAREAPRPRRRSLFEIRTPFASDRFSREYADAMDDMWVAECDQGDAGHAGKGIGEGGLFQRKVALGQDEFSREYFDTMEDMFVAESDLGDSGYLHGNPHHPTFNRIPEGLRRVGQNLFRPVKVGSDNFSREYAQEAEDVWLAQAGKGPSASGGSLLMRRVSQEYTGNDRINRYPAPSSDYSVILT